MADTTARGGLPYPQGGDPNDVPADLEALAARVATLLGAPRMSELERDALEGADLYDGRVIHNTDTGRTNIYDADVQAWLDPVDDLLPLDGSKSMTGGLSTTSGSAPHVDDAQSTYPLGYTFYGEGGGTWPGSGTGTVHTWNSGASSRTHQMFIDNATPPKIYVRRRVAGGFSAWGEVAFV